MLRLQQEALVGKNTHHGQTLVAAGAYAQETRTSAPSIHESMSALGRLVQNVEAKAERLAQAMEEFAREFPARS